MLGLFFAALSDPTGAVDIRRHAYWREISCYSFFGRNSSKRGEGKRAVLGQEN